MNSMKDQGKEEFKSFLERSRSLKAVKFSTNLGIPPGNEFIPRSSFLILEAVEFK
ncbi:hypothetical protein RHMOL_Rhmol03G0210500 [Rhododendron molle]|uniref:Uncharacterized protein n=1 Tax=Rhododendron molle TaxID=49168 RepID=A0ACC0PGK6_RHOML|nr:hypothetical protein RHMOL_Rhmol03G0210500 [Rhododendron molle]